MKSLLMLITHAVSVMTMLAAGETFLSRDDRMQRAVDRIAADALKEFAPKKLTSNQLAITVVDLRGGQPRAGSFRGQDRIYPASVIKLFYLASVHRWLEDGRLKDTAELRRAMRDMIVESSNDATHYIVDLLTETTAGPELPQAEMKAWGEKRNAVNRYFASLGYTNINANQKPWCDGPYGRERVWVGKSFGNRNSLTTDATARLLTELAQGKCISADRSREMMQLLARDRDEKFTAADDQAHGFSALGLPPAAKLWSKAGWTSTARHDAAYVEMPDGGKFVVVTFTTGHGNEREIIAFVARRIAAELSSDESRNAK